MSEASVFLAAVKWGEEGHYLREFATKFRLPQAAKIIKGQHGALGVPSLPSPHLHQTVLVASAGSKTHVVAQCVKFKERRALPVGGRIAVPEDYDGWFEILSEDGRSARCIESVAELARRAPKSCLLRDALRAQLPNDDKRTTLTPGAVLSVGDACRGGKFLACATASGDPVLLPMEARARFSPLAGEDNISGVHAVRTLARKRFPLMVRLVHGRPPPGVKHFAPEMRLYSVAQEEALVAMPLGGSGGKETVVPLPPGAPLKVLAPRNAEALLETSEHAALAARCRVLAARTPGCMQPLRESAPRRNSQPALQPPQPQPARKGGSDDEDRRYEEIDQIYDYVRGFAPLPPHIRSEFELPPIEPPEPPPVETIPARRAPHKVTVSIVSPASFRQERHVYEKIERRHKPANNKTQRRARKTIATSPLFHIRYKSLTDLLSGGGNGGGGGGGPPDGKSAGSSSPGSSSSESKESSDKRNALSRPKSLSNLVAEPAKRKLEHNYYNLVQNDLVRPPDLVGRPKFYSMPDAGRYAKNHAKKLGTLYL